MTTEANYHDRHTEKDKKLQARLFAMKAETKIGEKSYNGAVCDLDKAIGLDPGVSAFFSERAWCHFESNNIDDAIKDLRKAIELDGRDALLHSLMALCYVELDMFDIALNCYDNMIKIICINSFTYLRQ